MLDDDHGAVGAGEERPLVKAMALRAFGYCPRLFYLEEIEGIYLANEPVHDGRALHAEVERDEKLPITRLVLTSERWGLTGTIDCLRYRDGNLVPYEHKKGHARRDGDVVGAWPGDELQAIAYAVLVEEETNRPVWEARIRYHADDALVRISADDTARSRLRDTLDQIVRLRQSTERPPIAENPNLCTHCALEPVCLPEEVRRARGLPIGTVRVYPERDRGTNLHVLAHRAMVGKQGDVIVVSEESGKTRYPIEQLSSICLHGAAQITSAAAALATASKVDVHWFSYGGWYIGSLQSPPNVLRRIRQFEALTDPTICMRLARRLVGAKIEFQLRYILRATRTSFRDGTIAHAISQMRHARRATETAVAIEDLRGIEGSAGLGYHAVLRTLISQGQHPWFATFDRSRRPPRDRTNALLSFGYALLQREVAGAIMSVGLDPCFGIIHRPRTAAYPLVLDLMELFRTPIVDITVVGAINRSTFDPNADFAITGRQVWLSDTGKRKMIAAFERRLLDKWAHPILGSSLSYARLIELEVRLLEKEWTGEPGLFARMRLR